MKHTHFAPCLLAVAVLTSGPTPSLASNAAAQPPQSLLMPSTYHALSSKSTGSAELRTNHTQYRLGGPVIMAFEIRNISKKAIIYDYPTEQQFDLKVTNSQGKTVWDWAKHKSFSPQLTATKLEPGQQKTYRVTWNGRNDQGRPVSPGAYTIIARMTSTNRPGITGNFVTDPDTDPQNMGTVTRTPAENGVTRQVFTQPPLTASKKIMIR